MAKITIAVNLDTRPGLFDSATQAEVIFRGARSIDFLTEGIKNKINFFRGHETEVILFVDIHEKIPLEVFNIMDELSTSIVLSKHRTYFDKHEYYPKWNDINFLNSLTLARGEYIAHFDGDMAAFLKDPSVISEWKEWIDSGKCKYISYPSLFSPLPVIDPDFDDYTWVSTRFFFCKRETIKTDEIIKCLSDSNYLYGTYGTKKRLCPWLEHILGIMENKELIHYPSIQYDRYLLFAWNYYQRGLLEKLNNMSYEEVKSYVQARGISFPCDVWGNL